MICHPTYNMYKTSKRTNYYWYIYHVNLSNELMSIFNPFQITNVPVIKYQ